MEVTRAARRTHVVKVLRELGGRASREPTPERAREFREALEELGATVVKLGQILPSRPDLLPDVYLEELGRLADDVRRRLGLLLLALAQNRADDVADLIVSLSLVTAGSDQPGFVHEVRRKLPRYHWRPLAGIETGGCRS